MNFLFDPLKDILIDMITNMLGSISGALNVSSASVFATPSSWNPEVYRFIQKVANDIILPIGTIILTLIACYELINMIVEKNNLQDLPFQDLFKWLVKTVISIVMLSNMFVFIEAIFEVSTQIVSKVALLSYSSSTPDLSGSITAITDTLDAQNIAELTIILLQCSIMWIGFFIINTFLLPMIVAARMFNIYIIMILSPIPFATFGNREWSSMGQNYVKSLIAISLQAVLIQACFIIYDILLSTAFTGSGATSNPIMDIGLYFVYGVLIVFILWQTGSISKSIIGAH